MNTRDARRIAREARERALGAIMKPEDGPRIRAAILAFLSSKAADPRMDLDYVVAATSGYGTGIVGDAYFAGLWRIDASELPLQATASMKVKAYMYRNLAKWMMVGFVAHLERRGDDWVCTNVEWRRYHMGPSP